MDTTDKATQLCDAAKAAIKQRDATQAIALYEQAIAADPRNVAAHEGLAFVCFMTRQLDRAAELFLRVTRLDPRRVEPLINLGAVHNRQEDFAGAARVLRQALTKDRRNADAYYNLALAYRGQKQLSMAVNAYKEAIRLRPEMIEAHANLGNTLLEMKNNAQAVLAFERALSIDPTFKRAQVGLARAQDKTAEAKKAISPFGRLVDMERLEENKARHERQYRELSRKESFLDRDVVHRLAKESEQLAVGLLTQIRDELEVAVLSVSRTVSENREVHEWHREAGQFEVAVERFQHLQQVLFAKSTELSKHEQSLIVN